LEYLDIPGLLRFFGIQMGQFPITTKLSVQASARFIPYSISWLEWLWCGLVFAVVDLCDDEKSIDQEAKLGASTHYILSFIEVNILLKKRLNLIFTL
jgi:hypothetical protein